MPNYPLNVTNSVLRASYCSNVKAQIVAALSLVFFCPCTSVRCWDSECRALNGHESHCRWIQGTDTNTVPSTILLFLMIRILQIFRQFQDCLPRRQRDYRRNNRMRLLRIQYQSLVYQSQQVSWRMSDLKVWQLTAMNASTVPRSAR